MISRAAPSEANVLISGESGTGKELVARAIHAGSKRASGPFVAVNCAALPHTLLESELFGHTAGAFTDAKNAKEGLFVAANGGTIFLDEIGDMPVTMQVKLLRAIQERRVRPIGSSEEISFNTRIVAATNRDIDTDVDEGRFRSDLFYRLNVVRIAVPPLRSRGNDVLLLAQHFLARSVEAERKNVSTFSRTAAEKIMLYPFPGNVRELENMIERAVALAMSSEIDVQDLPEAIRSYRKTEGTLNVDAVEELISMDELEQRYITHVLRAVAGNKTQAAHVLQMDRKTLYRKLRRWTAGDQVAVNNGGVVAGMR
jgi:DNA-binding NtrC family response regulator